jgi:hypothetical protein
VDIKASRDPAKKTGPEKHKLTTRRVLAPQFIVGIENCAPSLMPDGQRAVTVLVRV